MPSHPLPCVAILERAVASNLYHARTDACASNRTRAMLADMGNRSRRELEGQAMLRAMLAHPPRERVLPRCDLCGETAVIGSYTFRRTVHFCEMHCNEAYVAFERDSRGGAR